MSPLKLGLSSFNILNTLCNASKSKEKCLLLYSNILKMTSLNTLKPVKQIVVQKETALKQDLMGKPILHKFNILVHKHIFSFNFTNYQYSKTVTSSHVLQRLNSSSILFPSNFKITFSQDCKHYSSKVKKEGLANHPIKSLKVKKRIQRKKRDLDEISEEEFPVLAYATAESYNFETFLMDAKHQLRFLRARVVSQDDKSSSTKISDPDDVLHFTSPHIVGEEPQKIYLFRGGVIVFWNVLQKDRTDVLSLLKMHEETPYSQNVIMEEAESLAYKYSELSTRIKTGQNLILFHEDGRTDLEKFTFSNVLAQSVKLSIWESALENYVDSIEHITEELSYSGRVILNQNEVLQKMGYLFSLRHEVNLRSDLLDTPDFYWDHESLEHLYQKVANYLSINKRTSVMNEKLSHCIELMDLLKNHLNERHSSRLEWIIIILIMIEVFFEILHFVPTDQIIEDKKSSKN